jgi:hypothetical protein
MTSKPQTMISGKKNKMGTALIKQKKQINQRFTLLSIAPMVNNWTWVPSGNQR